MNIPNRTRPRYFAWWYLSIGLGFLALAIRQIVINGHLPGIVVRLVSAAGFALLAVWEFRSRASRL